LVLLGLYQFFNNSQNSQENKNMSLPSLKLNGKYSINNLSLSSIKGSESQPVSKYGNSLSFSQSQQKDINNSWPINANNRPVKSFKDIDLIKNRVLNSSVISSDKVIADSVMQSIKFLNFNYYSFLWFYNLSFLFLNIWKQKREITSGLFDTIKTLSSEVKLAPLNYWYKYQSSNFWMIHFVDCELKIKNWDHSGDNKCKT